MEMRLFVMICAAVITFLFVALVHNLPWQMILGKRLPRRTAYVLGVLSIVVPFSASILTCETWTAKGIVFFLWLLCGIAGTTVFLSGLMDKYLVNRARANETEERENSMLDRVLK